MKVLIQEPAQLPDEIREQVVELLEPTTKIPKDILSTRLALADLVAVVLDNNVVVCTASIKNPVQSYRERIFASAGIPAKVEDYV